MNIPFVDLTTQYQTLKGEMDRAIFDIIERAAFIGGDMVARFEEAFADYIGMPHCVSTANGTEAIEVALYGLGLREGDEVIIPANTFVATAEGITAAGGRVVFADIDPDTYTISVEDLERKITPRTRVVMPVHLYGQPADMEGVCDLARRYNLLVVEDTAQAHGASFHGKRAGTFGDAATYSFYPSKNLGAYGDGGATLFRDADAAERGRMFANHGNGPGRLHAVVGRNSRLDGIQAAVLLTKLPYLDSWNAARRRNATRYTELLKDIDGVTPPRVADDVEHVFHLYVVRVADRDGIRGRLAEHGVHTGIHYPVIVPLLGAYAHLEHTAGEFPNAAGQMGEILSLPMYPELTDEQIEYVVNCLRQAIRAEEVPVSGK